MSSSETKAQIAQAIEQFQREVPALGKLQLVLRLELPARGGGAPPIWRVEVPGPKIDRDPAADARVDVSVPRHAFNTLAAGGRLQDWVSAYERGEVKVTGERAVLALIANVIQRRLAKV